MFIRYMGQLKTLVSNLDNECQHVFVCKPKGGIQLEQAPNLQQAHQQIHQGVQGVPPQTVKEESTLAYHTLVDKENWRRELEKPTKVSSPNKKDSGITEEVKPKTSTLGPEDDSLNKYFIKHSMMITIRADRKSQEHQLFRQNTPAWPTSASNNRARSRVLEAENSREERKFKQTVLGLNKPQEATNNGPTTTAGTGEEYTNEEFALRQQRRLQNMVIVVNTIGQSAHPQLAQQTSPASGQNAPLGQPDATTKKQI
ncbi:hypothetical protein GCK72_021603 [Caenorhabditis remanei]|uniref:Uncharacterized protein n=1 Tax=Caenorhabditis remanei TaxID=31234 RepID=A0A6A5GKH1_CAERE|nr:hypothetical protein GCK72_021603 [Caenorhabditis remanei]KAF1755035.1 hypothetical protein GCK72_021603 [Caenorhabditis remanei]